MHILLSTTPTTLALSERERGGGGEEGKRGTEREGGQGMREKERDCTSSESAKGNPVSVPVRSIGPSVTASARY